jgi:hypothetical protein
MKILTSLLLIAMIILVGCSYFEQPEVPEPLITEEPVVEEPIEEVLEEPVIEEPIGCTVNADCEVGNFCIDGECGTIADIYMTEGCTEKCNFDSVVVETSDDDTFTLNRGQGDYTAAGAIEWTLSSGPDYCKGEKVIVPVKIEKKNLGKILSEEYVTVIAGETSSVIKHPTMSSIAFTFKIKSVNEVCS